MADIKPYEDNRMSDYNAIKILQTEIKAGNYNAGVTAYNNAVPKNRGAHAKAFNGMIDDIDGVELDVLAANKDSFTVHSDTEPTLSGDQIWWCTNGSIIEMENISI